MTQRILFISLLALLFSCSEAQKSENADGFTIKAKIENTTKGMVYLEMINGQNFVQKQNTEVAEDGEFQFTGKVEEADFYRIRLYDGNSFFIVLDNQEINVTADLKNFSNTLKIEGSDDSNLFNEFVKMNADMNAKLQSIQGEYQQRMMNGDQMAQVEFQNVYQDLAKKNMDGMKKMVMDNPSSIVAPYLALSLDADNEFNFLKEVSAKISANQDNKYSKQLEQKVMSVQSVAVGQPAPEIELPSPDGTVLKLSDLKGKVVLIDFWASWCRPCRAENPNVVRLYKKYKDKNFEIFGVSLDKNKDAWVKAIENDGIEWLQVSDLQFWQSIAARAYQVNSIPRTFLIDEEGNIMAKNLRGQALETMLEKVLNK